VGLGHEGGTALLAIDNELDVLAVVVKSVEHGQVAFAGDSKGVGYALFKQALHK
jgi:hypothetical protein